MEGLSELLATADELYGLLPEDFVVARDERVRTLRRNGSRARALAVKDLRRPSAAAWLVNALVRHRRAEVEQLLALGEAMREQCEPAVRGYLNPPPSRSLQAAHWNHPGLYVLDATLGMLDEIGWQRIHARVDALTAELHPRLAEQGADVVTPYACRAGIVSVRVDDPVAAMAALQARGVHVEARGSVLRISPHFYNDSDDIERCLQAMQQSGL